MGKSLWDHLERPRKGKPRFASFKTRRRSCAQRAYETKETKRETSRRVPSCPKATRLYRCLKSNSRTVSLETPRAKAVEGHLLRATPAFQAHLLQDLRGRRQSGAGDAACPRHTGKDSEIHKGSLERERESPTRQSPARSQSATGVFSQRRRPLPPCWTNRSASRSAACDHPQYISCDVRRL